MVRFGVIRIVSSPSTPGAPSTDSCSVRRDIPHTEWPIGMPMSLKQVLPVANAADQHS
jgi:hypothetical protein